jgi:predicted DNA-binding transcriptional regulator AlpA
MYRLTKDYVGEIQAAHLLGVSRKTLRNWRYQGKGPPYHKLGARVRYRLGEVTQWVREQLGGPKLIWIFALLGIE